MRTQTIMESTNVIIDDFKDFAEFFVQREITEFIKNEEIFCIRIILLDENAKITHVNHNEDLTPI